MSLVQFGLRDRGGGCGCGYDTILNERGREGIWGFLPMATGLVCFVLWGMGGEGEGNEWCVGGIFAAFLDVLRGVLVGLGWGWCWW